MTRHTMKRNLVAVGASAALLSFGGAAALANGSHGSPGSNSAGQSASNSQILPISIGAGLSIPVNANVPVAVLSGGSNGGDVTQRNDSNASAEALNNETEQTVSQGSSGASGGTSSASQSASNSQILPLALGLGLSVPVNANVPVAVLSGDANGGRVSQRNDSNARAEALNNETEQTIRQGGSDRARGDNSASQSADSSQILGLALGPAVSAPLNPNVPVALLSGGSNGGDVDQLGDGDVFVEALNNDTDQSVRQDDSQTALSSMLSNVASAMTKGSATQLLGGL